MTGKLAQIQARISTVEQLSSVISAMRGMAAARVAEANHHLDGVRNYASAVARAIGQVLAASGEVGENVAAGSAAKTVIVAICAEQGFAGSFSHHILDYVSELLEQVPEENRELLLVGDRGKLVAAERGIEPQWTTAMISGIAQSTALCNRIMEALYERIAVGNVQQVNLVHAGPAVEQQFNIVAKCLIPFDFSRFPVAKAQQALFHFPRGALLEKLASEYIFAELCEAVVLSFAAENDARMRAMVSAQENVGETLEKLVSISRRQRQEDITNEIEELAASVLIPRTDD